MILKAGSNILTMPNEFFGARIKEFRYAHNGVWNYITFLPPGAFERYQKEFGRNTGMPVYCTFDVFGEGNVIEFTPTPPVDVDIKIRYIISVTKEL